MKESSGHEHWCQQILPYMIDAYPLLCTVNVCDGYFNGGTALHCAARFGLQHTVAYLLSRGSDGTARYKGGDDDNLSACVIARNHGWRAVAKMLRVFTLDDWRDWSTGSGDHGSSDVPPTWLRSAGRAALGRDVRVEADNYQIVEGTIDDFDPLRGMHHVNFKQSNAMGSWEGWFMLGRQCQLLSEVGSTIPSPPKKGVALNSRPPMPVDVGSSWGGFSEMSKDEAAVERYYEGTAYEEASLPAFRRSAVADAFERQARGMGML